MAAAVRACTGSPRSAAWKEGAAPEIGGGIKKGMTSIFGALLIRYRSRARRQLIIHSSGMFEPGKVQLNTIAMKRKQSLSKAGLDRDAILHDCTPRQNGYLVDRRIQIKVMLSWRRFLDVIADAVDDLSSSIGIGHDAAERLPDLV